MGLWLKFQPLAVQLHQWLLFILPLKKSGLPIFAIIMAAAMLWAQEADTKQEGPLQIPGSPSQAQAVTLWAPTGEETVVT